MMGDFWTIDATQLPKIMGGDLSISHFCGGSLTILRHLVLIQPPRQKAEDGT